MPEYDNALFNNKKSKCDPEKALNILKDLKDLYAAAAEWNSDAITQLVTDYAVQHEMKLGLPMWALRIAVSGTAVTPGGPGEIMTVLGREESLRRMDLALAKLS